MKTSTWIQLKQLFRNANQWFRETPERALDQAYDAALRIKAIEDEHFQGQKISKDSAEYGDRVMSYFESELKKCLNLIQTRLAEFNTSRSVLAMSESVNSNQSNGRFSSLDFPLNPLPNSDKTSVIYEKLDFIDSVVIPYRNYPENEQNQALVVLTDSQFTSLSEASNIENNQVLTSESENKNSETLSSGKSLKDELTSRSSTSFLPRSLLRTFGRIRRELNPESEEEVIKTYRKSKIKTIISIRFILLLILIPLLTQQLAKNFLVGPIVDSVMPEQNTSIFLNLDLEEEAYTELHHYQERLEFQHLIGMAPDLTKKEIEEKVKEKATELAEEYQSLGSNAIKNVFADVLSVLTFGLIIYTNKKDVEILKSFLGDLIYGLSDSAKAFIIILLTDMFVGFHSPHGWEVILESISRHFGLPESRDFNFLFIATFPVILDAVFKYWIFRYLNRSSPSAVSTYKTMNE